MNQHEVRIEHIKISSYIRFFFEDRDYSVVNYKSEYDMGNISGQKDTEILTLNYIISEDDIQSMYTGIGN